jgi:acyl-CoA synthetase (NDP forming)
VPGDLSRPGARPLHYLRRHRYPGQIHLVNPGRQEIGGSPVYPSLAAMPGPVDVAWIGVPGPRAAGVVEECGPAGIPFAVVLGAGFAETGEAGEAEQARLREAARRAGVRLLGPNIVGFVNAWDAVALTFSTVGELEYLPKGPIVLLSQSGGLGGILLNRAVDRGVGIGLFVSTGNEADLGLAECLDWVVDDGRARVVACVVEQPREPARLAAAVARARARDVAVLALKLGGTPAGARAARSHTGALVGRRDAWRAWARAAGILEVDDLDALLESAILLARARRPEGSRVGMLTSSGGSAVMLADALEPRGFTFPSLAPGTVERIRRLLPGYAAAGNPVDMTAGLPDETFGEVLTAMLPDPGLDFLVVPLTMATAEGGRARAEQVAWAARDAEKAVVVFWPGGSLVRKGIATLADAGIHVFTAVGPCAGALGAARDFGAWRTPGVAPQPRSRLDVPATSGALPWPEARRLVSQAGIPVVAEVVVASDEEARDAARALGFPAVVKLLGPLHKTEADGVRLGLDSEAAVLAAVRALLPRGSGCVIQPMVTGVEVLAGAVRDPALGPFVVLAPGGVRAELYRERAMRPAPIGPAEAEAMLDETPALAALLDGHRGSPAADRAALVEALVRLGALAAALGARLGEIDLNPLIVGPAGACAVDVRVILSE